MVKPLFAAVNKIKRGYVKCYTTYPRFFIVSVKLDVCTSVGLRSYVCKLTFVHL